MHKEFDTGLVWLRRDLRPHDNAALCAALQCCKQVHCAFVFDRAILDTLPRADRRVEFIRESLVALDVQLRQLAGKTQAGLIVCHGFATTALPALAVELGADAVFAAHDYEPQAIERDAVVRDVLQVYGIRLITVKDHVIFERHEVLTQMGKPYGVSSRPICAHGYPGWATKPPCTMTANPMPVPLRIALLHTPRRYRNSSHWVLYRPICVRWASCPAPWVPTP